LAKLQGLDDRLELLNAGLFGLTAGDLAVAFHLHHILFVPEFFVGFQALIDLVYVFVGEGRVIG
jgi:hypothetical protein